MSEEKNVASDAKVQEFAVSDSPSLSEPAQAVRAEVHICGRCFYTGTDAALAFMAIEALFGSASKQDLAEGSLRYMLRIEAFIHPTGNEKIIVCDRGVVDWGDGEHIVATSRSDTELAP